jgi:predicted lipid-binding transport protein (Tim44 family)
MAGSLAIASPAFAQTSTRGPEVRPDLHAGMQKIVKESARPIGDHTRASRAPKGSPPAPSVGQHKAQGALFAWIGALGGFMGGMAIGAKATANCCGDDPGMKGAIIGAPLGAYIGGTLGWIFGSR